MANLKNWLAQRALVFQDPVRSAEFGLSAPRVMLLVGVGELANIRSMRSSRNACRRSA